MNRSPLPIPRFGLPAVLALGLLHPAVGHADSGTIRELDELLAAARRNAVELQEADALQREAEAQAAEFLGIYDPTLFGNARFVWDESPQTMAFAGDRRDQLLGEVGARKLFPTATFLQASLRHERAYTAYPPPPPPQPSPIPGLPAQPVLDVSAFQSYNPAYTTRLELTARQALWRNFLGREFELQQELARAGLIRPGYERQLRLQVVQAETEQLWWALAAVEAQHALLTRILDLSDEFARQMGRRAQLGRAEDVDVAAAESAHVQREGALLQLDLARRELRRRLAIRTGLDEARIGFAALAAAGEGDMPGDATGAVEQALQGRADLALIEASREPLRLQARLAREQQRPELGLLGSLGSTGLKGSAGRSVGDSVNGLDQLTWVVGIEVEVPLGNRGPKAREQAAGARLAALDAQAAVIRRDVQREVELALQLRDGARERLAQVERQREALQRKRDLTAQRFRQARTDGIAVVGYEIEVLNVDMERIAAMQSLREAEARLRMALHAYPREN